MITPTLHWLSHNLALGDDDVSVRVVAVGTPTYITLEEALRRIDEFDEYGRSRIIATLPFQFEMGAA